MSERKTRLGKKVEYATVGVSLTIVALTILVTFGPIADRERGLWQSVEYNLEVKHIRGGLVIWSEYQHNLVVNNGFNFTRDKLSGTSFDNASRAIHISLSNNSTAVVAADTEINSEYITCSLNRAAGTYVITGIGTWNVSHTYTSSCVATTQVQKAGLSHNSTQAVDGYLVAGATFSLRELEQNDQIQVTWEGTIQ